MRSADPALLPTSVGAAAGGRSRHELPDDVAARIAAGVPENTRRAWFSRYARYHAWAAGEGYEQAMPPTDPMLAAYLDYLGYDQQLKVSTLTAHLGSLIALTRAWVADTCARRAAAREGRARARAAELDRLDAEQHADADLPADDPAAAVHRAKRTARRAELDAEELADAREAAADPQVPDTVLAQRALKGYAGSLARTGQARGRRKASVLTPEQIRRIILRIDTSTAIGKRDKALLLVWFEAGRRSDETSALYTADIALARPHGMRVRISRSKTDPHGLGEDTLKILYSADPLCCAVRAVEDWLAYLASPVDELKSKAPRYAAPEESRPLWPRIDRRGVFGIEAWSPARASADDDGGLSTKALYKILRRRAADVGIKSTPRSGHGNERVQVSTHTMRRSFITAAANAGADINDVAAHVGIVPGSRTIYEYWDFSDRGWEHSPTAKDILQVPKPGN